MSPNGIYLTFFTKQVKFLEYSFNLQWLRTALPTRQNLCATLKEGDT